MNILYQKSNGKGLLKFEFLQTRFQYNSIESLCVFENAMI